MKFKVGDEVMCECRNCKAVTIQKITDQYIFGVTKDGIEASYFIDEDLPRLRKVTKLDRALK